MKLAPATWRTLFLALAVAAGVALLAAGLIVGFAPDASGGLLVLTLGVLVVVIVAEVALLLMAPKPQE